MFCFSNQSKLPMFPFMQNQGPVGHYGNSTWTNVNPQAAHNSSMQNNLNVSYL